MCGSEGAVFLWCFFYCAVIITHMFTLRLLRRFAESVINTKTKTSSVCDFDKKTNKYSLWQIRRGGVGEFGGI